MSIDENAADKQQANTPAETENATESVTDPVQSGPEAQEQFETENVSLAAGTAEENGHVNENGTADDAAEEELNQNSAEEKGDEEADEASISNGFDALNLPDDVLDAIRKVGFEEPSPIQAQTIPLLMEGRDVVGLAQTGTGKTAAFALPVLARIDKKARHPQALVLAPTRELALQVSDSFQSFADHLGGISVLPIYGGQAYGIQLSGLRRGAQIIVGTPGRVIDHLEKGSLDISDLRFLVLDEADEMLNMGFQEDVERILEDLSLIHI